MLELDGVALAAGLLVCIAFVYLGLEGCFCFCPDCTMCPHKGAADAPVLLPGVEAKVQGPTKAGTEPQRTGWASVSGVKERP